MRTTLDLDEDVLLAAKELAGRRGQSIGRVLSDLARRALTHETDASERNNVPLFPVNEDSAIVSPELVNQLRDEAE